MNMEPGVTGGALPMLSLLSQPRHAHARLLSVLFPPEVFAYSLPLKDKRKAKCSVFLLAA